MKQNVNVLSVSSKTVMSTQLTGIVEIKASEFHGFARKSVENFLEMGRCVFIAKSEANDKAFSSFNQPDYKRFLQLIGYKPDSSALKKLNVIGKKYSELKDNTANLPDNWTTVYEIARLSTDEFTRYINEGVINKNVSGSEIKLINGSKKVNQDKYDGGAEHTEEGVIKEEREVVPNETGGYTITLDVHSVTNVALKAKLNSIIDTLRELKVVLVISPDLESLLQPSLAIAA